MVPSEYGAVCLHYSQFLSQSPDPTGGRQAQDPAGLQMGGLPETSGQSRSRGQDFFRKKNRRPPPISKENSAGECPFTGGIVDGRTDYACAEVCCVDMKSPGNLRRCRHTQNFRLVRLTHSSDAMTNRETNPTSRCESEFVVEAA
jgi:hypothetical protein